LATAGPEASAWSETSAAAPDDHHAIRYQTDSPTYEAFPHWVESVLKDAIRKQRFAALEPTRSEKDLDKVLQPVPLQSKGLSKKNPQTGEIEDAPDENRLASYAVPGALMVMMFMMILVGSTPLMQSVVEEKMQRIAEVLLGSVRPFELMMGKLLGMVGVSLTLAVIYLGAAYGSAHRYGFTQYIPVGVLVWFVAYQTLAVLMVGSLFVAVGAACSDMRETQTMVWPVMLLVSLPMFVWINVIQEPNSTFSTWISLFPFATPMLMLGRQAVPPGIPWWQPAAGVTLVLLTTVLCVYAAGRIFRVGILMQGKGAQVSELVKWVFRG
jgi:ABC-2 type transport system permease protein